MSLRWRLRAYLIGLHLVFFAFTLVLYGQQAPLFIAVELLLLASLAGGMHLIKLALAPLTYTQCFHDLLQDQNYSARLTGSGSADLDQLIGLFNGMLTALCDERLKLGEQQGLLDRLHEATPSAVIVFDFDGAITLVNASAQSLLDLDAPKGKPLTYWQDAAPADGLDEARRDRRAALLAQLDALPIGESRLLTDTDGRRYRAQRGQFFDRSFARHFLLVEELTAELDSSEKAAYEKLIRVLAHEVNNTVAATGSVLDSLLFYRGQLAERDGVDFATAIEAVKRRNTSLGEFIERFTRVVKMPAPELRPTKLTAIMDDIVWMYREQCRSRGITLAWRHCEDLPDMALDRQLMEQALLNIVKNAMEAVEAGMAEQGERAGHVHLTLEREGERARLSITDSGNRLGHVPPNLLFSPFFTTKRGGQGIGLMFVREVLQRHGLTHRLAPTGAQETRFDIWFPLPQPA